MKQQQSATKKIPSKFCKILLLLVGFKLCLLSVILLEPFIDLASLFDNQNNESMTSSPQSNAVEDFNQFAATAELSLPVTANAPAAQLSGHISDSVLTAAEAESFFHKTAKTTSAPVKSLTGVVPSEPLNLSAGLNQPTSLLTNSGMLRGGSGVAYAATGTAMDEQSNSLALEAMRRKQEELDRKEQDLKALQVELDARLLQMQEVEMRLNTMLREADEIKSDKFRQLIDVLSNMKARQAAQVLETLDERIAVKVLSGMRGRQAGEILSLASAEKAARLAEALAKMQMPLD